MAYNTLSLSEKLSTKAIPQGDCLVWIGQKNPQGYGRLRIKGNHRPAHRLAYELHIGPIANGMVICHTCDNPACINPKHLFAATQHDNIADMWQKGRAKVLKGESKPNSKLTAEQVIEIRRRYNHYDRCNGTYALAREFGVNRVTIRHLIIRKTWKHVP